MVKRPLSLLTGLLTFLVLTGHAQAAGGLLVLRADGDGLKPAESQALDTAIDEKLKKYTELKRVAPPQGDIMDIMIDLECIDLDGDCLGRIGEKAGAERVLYVGFAKKGTGLKGTLRWTAVATKSVTATDEVDAKTPRALNDAMAILLEKQLGAPPAPVAEVKPELPIEPPVKKPEAVPGTLIVETNRIQAQIFINQEYAGTGTATIEREAGRYTLRVTHPGDETQVIEVDIESGKTATRQVTLKSSMAGGPLGKDKPPPKVEDSDDSWVIWVIVGAVVVAGAATAVGIAASGGDAKPSGTLLLGLDPSGAWRDPVTRGGRR